MTSQSHPQKAIQIDADVARRAGAMSTRVLPVCMGCGQIKGDGAEWQSVVAYLAMNRIFMSHGYRPSCAETQLASFDESEPE
jgi:hypothetical protein